MKIVIVGGVAGGASAAARARRLSENAEIVLLERGKYVSFANCGLPYYVGDEIQKREKLIVTSPQRLRERLRIDVRVCSKVVRIDRPNRKIHVVLSDTGESYTESYDRLILSPGASPIRPELPGRDLPNVLTLRTLEDVDRIRALVDRGMRSAIVVGAGFIGLEMVENLVRRGVKTTLVQLQNQVLSAMDREMTAPLESQILKHGVDLRLGQTLRSIEPSDQALLSAELTTGERIQSEMILLGIGVRPENQLAIDSGLSIGERGGIVTNSFMQTSDPDIYAVGDAVEVEDFVMKSRAQIALAGPANRQGRIAADHIFGRAMSYRGTQGTAIVRIFDSVAATTGASERTLKKSNVKYQKIYIHPASHASYYPGASGMSIKLLFEEPSGRILGAQIVGGEGVDKRIDVIAMAIQGGMTVFDLEEAELAYAPQFGSAKDPINMAGFVAAGVLRGDHPVIHADQLIDNTIVCILDVRTEEEYTSGSIPGARNIPIDTLRSRLDELPNDRQIITYCQVGQRGYLATRILSQKGFQVRNLSGGFSTYRLFHPAVIPLG
ncbi:MAG: FAD-dependent oxidoreductase [Planctomycetes bacterium]|nr:FAD-dependent oxidoreductase [Planctomycetota bacterium]